MSKQLLRSAKNVMNGYSPAQVLVRNATSNEEYGPSLDQMEELAERTYSAVEFYEIMIILEKRLSDKPKNWRHVAKSLTVVDFLVRAGADTCVDWARENIFVIRKLTGFIHVEDVTGVDHGQLIRVKAKELISLLQDEERLREERALRLGRNKRDRSTSQLPNREESDAELQRALEESRITAEEEERRRKQAELDQMDDDELRTALQLSKEEEELRKLRELQQQRDQQLAFWQQQQQQQQSMYYDIFGNPISHEEYLQFQQQQEQAQQQQAQQQLLAQQLAEQQAAEQQYYAQQQYLAQQQQYLAQQQMMAQQQLKSGPNNPFSLENVNKLNSNNTQHQQQQQQQQPLPTTFGAGFNVRDSSPAESSPPPKPVIQQPSSQQSTYSQPQQPLTATRTGNQSITDKYGELNELLASGTGLDTFGNTGQTRIPAQHTKTGTFINSQGTGYKQVGQDASKHNPFLTSQYTGLPSTNMVPSHTGYGFGNNQSYTQNNSKPSDQGMSLIDL